MNSQDESAHSGYRGQEIGIKFRAQFKSVFFYVFEIIMNRQICQMYVWFHLSELSKKDTIIFKNHNFCGLLKKYS